jgi:phage terminase large subunit-like protein
LTPKTSAGFEACRFATVTLGIQLLPWQRWLLIHMLELNPDGTFRFRTVLTLVARQNGKTTLLQVLALWRMYVDAASLIIGTAQSLDVAEEAWEDAVALAKSVPELASMIEQVRESNGKKTLKLETGERYKVAASSRRGGRGLSGDLALLDELREHQSWEAWAAVTKTTMARPNPQIACFSNAGDAASIVLVHLRTQALAAIAGTRAAVDPDDPLASLALFEWSAADDCLADVWAGPVPRLGVGAGESCVGSHDSAGGDSGGVGDGPGGGAPDRGRVSAG